MHAFGIGVLLILGVMFAPFFTVSAIMYNFGYEGYGLTCLILGIINVFLKILKIIVD